MTTGPELDEHFLRRESGRIVAALARIFGVHNLALAEDVLQDAYCRALEVWKVRGIPENPSAWLTATAKHRAIDIVRRERTARTFAPELGRLLESEWTLTTLIDEAFAAHTIRDEQLRMMFSCCKPQLPEEAQLALILNVLCGFGPTEIAGAFLTGRAAIEKRIARGKTTLASCKRLFDLGDAEFAARLSTVQRVLYLLFNEGYHGCAEPTVRGELCDEALRLVALLCEHPAAATPSTHALAALMCLHAARLPARLDREGDLSALTEQDRTRWNPRLCAEGLTLLERAATGQELSAYHVEAAIVATHAAARCLEDTDWPRIAVRSADGDRTVAGGRAQSRCRRRAVSRTRPGARRAARNRGARPARALSVLSSRTRRARAAPWKPRACAQTARGRARSGQKPSRTAFPEKRLRSCRDA